MAKSSLFAAPDGCTLRFDGHLCARPGTHCDDHQCECGHRWPAPSGVQVLRLLPDDVLVLGFNKNVSAADADKAAAQLKSGFPDHRVLITNHVDLLVVRPDVADQIKE